MTTGIIVVLVAGAIFFMIVFSTVIPIPFWIAAVFSGVKISIFSLVGMRLRRVPPKVILMAMIQSKKAGLDIQSDALEAHYLAKGNVIKVVNALVAADKANIPLTLQRATAIDLAGRDVL
ncbi:MAG: flotillin-like FloA family protein, partial [Victivallales bacterium]|nr:flotillin-like FloA family protein [Victivallales bacterium]